MMKRILLILSLIFTSSSYALNAGEKVLPEHFNQLNDLMMEREVLLFEGNHLINYTSYYPLWDESLHEDWDYMDLYIAYDSTAVPHRYRVAIPEGYTYVATSEPNSVLISTHSDHYRRILFRKTGLDARDGGGSTGSWYLKKAVGIKMEKLNFNN